MTSAFSNSVEVKITDTTEAASSFGIGAGYEVYPFDISLCILGTNTKTEPLDGYTVTISLPVPEKLPDEKERISIVHRSDDGTVTTLISQLKQINGVWYLVFEATEFSTYALVVSNMGTYDETVGLPYYADSNGNEVFIGFAANGKYIAHSGVTVLFKENQKSFTDTGTHWAKGYIKFVAERELFNGTGINKFSPDTSVTRAMFATVIGRLFERGYGEIETMSSHAFTDCDYDEYYGKYVDRAAENGILDGYGNGKFGPGDAVTREQIEAILYRFADFLDALPDDIDSSLRYPDSGDISNWAESAALYCQSTGTITGRDGGSFVPQGTATRAEAAAIIRRFIESILA
ncbi:MAG: S-layer homology domain-containing protein [Clostridiales bacterium]|nr:S-layer homology domain-containing protein [Clostridiales bacterium]